MTEAPPGNGRLGREDWISAARAALVKGGVASVKIDRLAADLAVTRGSFYWHFKSRAELLDALLASWQRTNSEPFLRVLSEATDADRQLHDFIEVWLKASEFDPNYDSAVRDWARASPQVAQLVRETDDSRIGVLRSIFATMGCDEEEAEVRARVTYYHQVGYYALRIVEPISLRRALFPTYFKALAGRPMRPVRV